MPRRKLQEFDQYRYGAWSVLRPGDRFRVMGGPVYITDDGRQFPMYERGEFVFCRYWERGAQKWIVARRADSGGTAILWVGRTMRSPQVPNIRRRPYRITRKIRQDRRAVPTKRRTRAKLT